VKFSAKVDNEPANSWLNFGGDPDHRLDTGIVFRIRYHYEIGNAGLRCNYDVITSLALGGGMHCSSASSLCYVCYVSLASRCLWTQLPAHSVNLIAVYLALTLLFLRLSHHLARC